MTLRKIRFFTFAAGGLITGAVSIGLFAYLNLSIGNSVNVLATITLLGAPIAYWIAWVGYPRRWLKPLAILLYVAFIAPTFFSHIAYPYLPGLFTLIAGSAGNSETPHG